MKHKFKFAALAVILFAATMAGAADHQPTTAECLVLLNTKVNWPQATFNQLIVIGNMSAQCMIYDSLKDSATAYAAAALAQEAARMGLFLDHHGEYQKFIDEDTERLSR